jgi:hypothetical protein
MLLPATQMPGRPNMAFVLMERMTYRNFMGAYGLTMYSQLLRDAVTDVLYRAGYNHPGSLNIGKKLTKDQVKNPENWGKWGTPMTYFREVIYGGKSSGNSRYAMLWNEVHTEAVQRCLERVASGETVTLVSSGNQDHGKVTTITTEDQCELVGKRIEDGGFRPTDMEKAGILGKNLVKAILLMELPNKYFDGELGCGLAMSEEDRRNSPECLKPERIALAKKYWETPAEVIDEIHSKITVGERKPLTVSGTGVL